jgi:prepilin-type N-terminal cleavage/methylation domain-containing protein
MTKDRQAILPNQNGFTLVEIMVTLVIIAIAAALVSPAIMQMAPNMALKSAAQDLYSNMQRAKVAAIKENRVIAVTIGSSGYTVGEPFKDATLDGGDGDGLFDGGEVYTDTNGDGAYTADIVVLFDEDTNGNGILDAGEDQNGNGRLDTNYGVMLGTGNATKNWDNADCIQATTIQFTGRGLIANPPGSGSVYIHNKNADISYAVSVLTTGSVKGRKYDGADTFSTAHWVE